MTSLFVRPPKIDPAAYLSPSELVKSAGVQLTQPPSFWDDEITQILLRDYPFIPTDSVVVNFKQRDDASGTAAGFVTILGAPRVSIPIIIKQRNLAPLDIMIVRSQTDDNDMEQGTGDMEDNEVQPLTQANFEGAMDQSDPGAVMPDHMVRGTGWSEDGSTLRLPFRGRTVLASVMGAQPADLEKFAQCMGDGEVLAGVYGNKLVPVFEAWLQAAAPVNSITQKLASLVIDRGVATVFAEAPIEFNSAEFEAGEVALENDRFKTAAAVDFFDLMSPDKTMRRGLIWSDGTYGYAPETVVTMKTAAANDDIIREIFSKVANAAIAKGAIVSFVLDGQLTAPMKVAKLSVNGDTQAMRLELTDGMRSCPLTLTPLIKTAMFDDVTTSWVLPADAQVLQFAGYSADKPAEPAKVAAAIEARLPDRIVCVGGNQYAVEIRGDRLGDSLMDEAKTAEVLGQWLTNGDAVLQTVKQAAIADDRGNATLRFSCDIPETTANITKIAKMIEAYPAVAHGLVDELKMELGKAVKLAAAVGDPNGVDAVLGTGFLCDDNVAEFTSLAPQFQEAVGKLARLLLGIRMGFAGDETAVMVAMKSLQRVVDRLRSAVQTTIQ